MAGSRENLLLVQGRLVVVITGSKTQTVNICTRANLKAVYRSRFRLRGTHIITDMNELFAKKTLADLVAFLLARQGVDELRKPPGPPPPLQRPPISAPKWGDVWLTRAIPAVESAIASLVVEFDQQPYLHRVEHSLHARLFELLDADPLFSARFPIASALPANAGSRSYLTQSIHKEWPETISHMPAGNFGNFDLALISPQQAALATVKEFRAGRIVPAIVIEVGLDYDYQHLESDRRKLINSRVIAGYLIHFSRDRPRYQRVEELVENLDESKSGLPGISLIRTAYVNHARDGTTAVKSLGADKIWPPL